MSNLLPFIRSTLAIVTLMCTFLPSVICFAQDASEEGKKERPSFEFKLIDADGSNLRTLTTFDRACGSPQWSPDGKEVAYDTWDHDEDYPDSRIEVMNVESLEQRTIGLGAMPSWSPDGKQIVCHTYDQPQTICVLNVDGSGREVIMDQWGSPRWSPVDDRIVTANSTRGVTLFDLRTGKETVVAERYRPLQGLSVSPDGKRICFGDQQGGVILAKLSPDATAASCKFILTEGKSFHSSWSPDGKQIVLNYRAPDAKCAQLYLYDTVTNNPPVLLPDQSKIHNNRDPSWSPDGETILYVCTSVLD